MGNNLSYNYFQEGHNWTIDSLGLEQSPIDIMSSQCCLSNNLMKMEFFLTDQTLSDTIINDTGSTLLATGPFSKLRATDVDGQSYEYEAIQFHFHAPAEHTINGGLYALELHIVHQMTPESMIKREGTTSAPRDLAVVAIFFDLDTSMEATPNAFIDALRLDSVGSPLNLNMSELLKDELQDMKTFFAYKGSLTSPPCSESVNWYVFEKPLKITQKQLTYFNQRWKDNISFGGGHGNNRTVQPLNGRTVMKSMNCCVSDRSEESTKKITSHTNEETKPKHSLKLPLRSIFYETYTTPRQSQSRQLINSRNNTPTYNKSNNEFRHPDTPLPQHLKGSLLRAGCSPIVKHKSTFAEAIM